MDLVDSDSEAEREKDAEFMRLVRIRTTDFTPEMQLGCAKASVEAF